MKKTILKSVLLTAIASLAVSGYAWAHHPSADVNPNFETIDENISDMHIEIVDALMEEEDNEFMASTQRSADANDGTSTPQGDDTTMQQSSASGAGANQGMAPTGTRSAPQSGR